MAKLAGWKKEETGTDGVKKTHYDCNMEFPDGAMIPPGTTLKLTIYPNEKNGNDKAPDIRGETWMPRQKDGQA